MYEVTRGLVERNLIITHTSRVKITFKGHFLPISVSH
jgi:hypothetical protein